MILPTERDHFVQLHVDMRIVLMQVLERFHVHVSSICSCCSMCISLVVMEDDVKLPHCVHGSQHGSASIYLVCEPLKMKVMCLQNTSNRLHSDAIPGDPQIHCFENLTTCTFLSSIKAVKWFLVRAEFLSSVHCLCILNRTHHLEK